MTRRTKNWYDKPKRSPEEEAFLDRMTDQIVAAIDSMPDPPDPYAQETPSAPPPEREINPMPGVVGLTDKHVVWALYVRCMEQLAQSTDKEFVEEAYSKLAACFKEVMSDGPASKTGMGAA